MQIFIENAINQHDLQAILNALSDKALFESGEKTAGRAARKVKKNLQAYTEAPEIKGAAKLVEKSLLAHPVFSAAAVPDKFVKIMFNYYEPGMQYGTHIDEAIINGMRTDLSFTLFLSDPDSYSGGELLLTKNTGEEEIKLPKGALCLYPSTSLHAVSKVTSGRRLAAVGWVQSRIRLAEHREILFDLEQTLASLPDSPENQEIRLNLLKVKSNILRLWINK